MNIKRSGLGLWCVLAFFGCGSHAALPAGSVVDMSRDASPSPSDRQVDGGTCSDLTQQAKDFVAAHLSCSVDGDCTGVPNFGFIYDQGSHVSCWPQIVIAKDSEAGFVAIMNQMFDAKCSGPTQICSASVPSASCKQNVCVTP